VTQQSSYLNIFICFTVLQLIGAKFSILGAKQRRRVVGHCFNLLCFRIIFTVNCRHSFRCNTYLLHYLP